MKKTASARWQGGIKDGQGSISSQSGVLNDTPYGFNTRFTDQPGTNPEELIGAAHAACFSMALSKELGDAGMTAERIDTKAEVTLDKVDGGFEISAVHLSLRAKIPGAERAAFEKAVETAKTGCPVSKVLNAKITLEVVLDS
ncbi:OsmC family protein [Ectopseudomonas hydrolytica]|uniref:OsmC family protein n=1 Tax=Ectopseudomonas mendocina (strain ymp) TaxID=399739 RepID=A4Y0T4_ECTM1|nr:OsmC family protein [Pseudomonas hydrolytica]MBF8162958.1 OsmC family protein [Pseudomonas mendocina]UTH31558.1 OsmC family protein [Pseudomonas hydrolytica]UZZ10751.1 OsmC family protein [Pseudomonas mendocina]